MLLFHRDAVPCDCDHVPPIFGESSFAAVVSSRETSLKNSFEYLQNGLRNIADGFLHQHIRHSESIPSSVQVDYKPQIDQLLAEVIRSCKT